MSRPTRTRFLFPLAVLAAAWLLLVTGPAEARNADLSLWLKNLSGDEVVGETWYDQNPEIAVVGSTVHVLWTSRKSDWREARLYYRRSLDGGRTFSSKVLLYSDTDYSSLARTLDRRLAVDGTTVHVVTERYRPPSSTRSWYYEVQYLRSADNGATFSPARVLFTGGDAWHVQDLMVVANAGKVTIGFNYIANWYRNYHVTLLNSSDAGLTFSQSIVAESSERSGKLFDLTRVGDNVHALYYQLDEDYWYGHWQARIGAASSTNGGKNFKLHWLTTQAANGEYLTYWLHASDHYSPNLATAGDNVYAVWTQNDTDYNSPNVGLYFWRSTDKGQTFSAPQKLSLGLPAGLAPAPSTETVSAHGSYVYVVFVAKDRIFFRRSADSGSTFGPLRELTSEAGTKYVDTGGNPLVRTRPSSATQVHVLWNWPTWRSSSDGGTTFQGALLVSPHFSWWECRCPQMTVGADGTVHFVVRGLFNVGSGDSDIFYRRLASPPVETLTNRSLMLVSDYDARRFDNAQVPGNAALNFTNTMTVEAWIRPAPGSARTARVLVKQKEYSWNSVPKGYQLGTHDSNNARRPNGGIRTTADQYVLQGDEEVPDGKWTHLALTYDAGVASNNLRLLCQRLAFEAGHGVGFDRGRDWSPAPWGGGEGP